MDLSQKISVVIPTYNYDRFIREALESALNQTCEPQEILVIDDGSTDKTEEIVLGFADRGVKYLGQENAGVCTARNRGVAESQGEFIAFLDADDIWEAAKLEKQVAMLIDNPSFGLVHCGMREFESDTGDTISLRTEGRAGDVADGLLVWEEPVVNVSGSCLVVRREAFNSVGGFDTRMKCGEDWDFCYRVARKYKVGFVAEPLVNYRIHGAAAHRNVEEMERGMALFYEKAFATDDENILRLRRRALGNYHKVMAGSFWYAGRLGKFAEHAIKSIWKRPSNLVHFANFPVRRFFGKQENES